MASRSAVAALRVEPPLQFVALDDQRAGDQAVALPQRRVPDVDQQRLACPLRPYASCGSTRSKPARTRSSNASIDGRLAARSLALAGGAHCQSSGRSTCSRRSTCPVRL